ncbi:MAG: inorganic phosphate transporter [Saprospiraceae bacterium]
MLILFFISSGLFLGWSLGANDAANIFGTAVGTRMIKFTRAALIASVFVILGAVLQGSGTTNTLSQLGKVDALGGAFTVALCSAVIVAIMTKNKLPVSTGQAIVGSIVAWCYFTAKPVDYGILTVLVSSWIYGPILGAVFAALLYIFMRKFIRTTTIHVIKLDILIRYALILTGAFGAYSLGANNIANVMGVFVHSASIKINFWTYSFDTIQILFLLGGISIAIGIITYSKKVMETVGGDIMTLTPENAIVVVLAQALVLFIFSSSSLSDLLISIGLPPIPLVPVSSTQVVIGSVLGIGLVKGVQEVKFGVLRNIALGWVLTPILSGLLTFFSLFFVQNVFDIGITDGRQMNSSLSHAAATPIIIHFSNDYLYIVILSILALLGLGMMYLYILFVKIKNKYKLNQEKLTKDKEHVEFHRALSELEVNILSDSYSTGNVHENRKSDLRDFTTSINEIQEYLQSLLDDLKEATNEEDVTLIKQKLEKITLNLKEKSDLSGGFSLFLNKIDGIESIFLKKLRNVYTNLTIDEQKLALLLEFGFSDSEIISIFRLNHGEYESYKNDLRIKLNLTEHADIANFLKSI